MRAILHPVLFAVVLSACAATAAHAVTLDQIIALSKAGVSDEVILTMIDRDQSVFAIESDRLVTLKREGVSEAVVIAMLKSGRQPPPEPAAAPLTAPMVGPEITIVGHHPDRPNVGHGQLAQAYVAFPYGFLIGSRAACAVRSQPAGNASGDRATFGRFTSDPTARFQNNGFVTTADADDASQVVVSCPPAPSRARPRRR